MTAFHAMADLKQTAQAKILMSPISIRKRAHQIVEHAYHQRTHFIVSQSDHHLGDAIALTMFHLRPLHLKKLRMVVCVIVFSF